MYYEFCTSFKTWSRLKIHLRFLLFFTKSKINHEIIHKLIVETELETLYSNIINEIRRIFDMDFDDLIENKDVLFFEEYMPLNGIHGNSNNDTSINSSSHLNKLIFFFQRVFLINNNYRITRYPKLGKLYFYPICLIYHWIYLLAHKLGSFFKFLFGKNKNKLPSLIYAQH